jgi:hypothetical protein
MSRITTALLGVILGLAASLVLLSLEDQDSRPCPLPSQSVQLQEDDPGWDCRTMGNGCGPLGRRIGGV